LTKTSAAALGQSNFAVDDRSEELAIHRLIGNHPNIVNLVHHFETESHVYLVLEYCSNGDLYEAIRLGRGPLETENIRDAMLQLIDAVDFMHSKGVYHRDIKPGNIFLSNTGAIKLGDFGLASKEEMSTEAAVGSDRYMAPEQMEPSEDGYSPAKADVWALGICLLNVLFARNPFATPTLSDPLFADFASDRQTLFDVFPNMSQDTFDVLVHCLALDPVKRSLELAREAVQKAVTFTTDDEILDDFCAAPVTMATANREPLRTPSISSPQIDQGGAFPWAKALAMTSPVRQLSVIKDVDLSDALFDDDNNDTPQGHPLSQEIYPSSQVDNASLVSFVDSGLGLSVKSSNMSLDPAQVGRSKPVPISGSLPATAARPIPSLAAVFGKGEFQSKSWSDIWDEDFAQASEMHLEVRDEEYFRRHSLDSLASVSNGSNTPRVGLSELKNPEMVNNSRSRSPEKVPIIDERVSDDTGFLFEEHHSELFAVKATTLLPPHKYNPPSKRSIADKWAALGDRRRAYPPSTRSESRAVSAVSPPLSIPSNKRSRLNNSRKGLSWNIWGQSQPKSNISSGSLSPDGNKKQWNSSKDWRKHDSSIQDAPAAERSRPLEWVWRL